MDQMELLAAHNATLSLWWQDYSFPADEQGTIGEVYGIKTAVISPSDGFYLLDFLKTSSNMTAVFPNPIGDVEGKPNPINGGKMSYFSSWGLTNRLDIKPDISAPGGNILSTYPTYMGDYAVLSGTSMVIQTLAYTNTCRSRELTSNQLRQHHTFLGLLHYSHRNLAVVDLSDGIHPKRAFSLIS
jgi:subtilisin family serine protease